MKRDGTRLVACIILAIPCLLLVGVGLLLLIQGGYATLLRCERASDTCTLTVGNRIDRSTQRFALSEIQQAVVLRLASRTYTVEIRRTNGLAAAHIAGQSLRNEAEHRQIAEAFNRFLQNQQTPTYVFSQAAPPVFAGVMFALLFGALFGGLSYWQFFLWQEGE